MKLPSTVSASTGEERDVAHRGRGGNQRGGGDGDSPFRDRFPVPVEARQRTPGALNEHYDIPVVTFSRWRVTGLVLTGLLITALVGWRSEHVWQNTSLLVAALPILGFRAFQWLSSFADRPVIVTAEVMRALSRLNVVVTVPVYNEDPALLDRCLYALINQTRLPQRIDVIDDGSKLDYAELQNYWERRWPCGTQIRWIRQPNEGKRRAHAVTFASAPEADIFITVDSDTTLDLRAVEEGLKPFRRRNVQSVAGIEFGFNANENFLTLIQSSLQLYSQAVVGAVWSVTGNMYTNRGPFALYRAAMVREVIDLYRDETFFGCQVRLGDDSLLALCASARGRSVQQLSAFGLSMWPETLGHHMRQRIRWARGRAVRNCWRVRYLPITSYTWWFTVTGIFAFLVSLASPVLIAALWPFTIHEAGHIIIGMTALAYPSAFRALCFRRSDETRLDRALLVLVRPIAAVWASVVLARIVRAYGTATCLRQGWTTRQQGAELVFTRTEEADLVFSRTEEGATA